MKENRCFKVTKYECFGLEEKCKFYKRAKHCAEGICKYQDLDTFECCNDNANAEAYDS